jgi:manganese-dependent ADP-ribose/CDP-alcohol diphosphatase
MNLLVAFSLATILTFDMPENKFSQNEDSLMSEPELPDQKPLFSFGIISDVQYADINPAGTRYYRSSLDKLEEAISAFRHDSVNFIVNLGDLIEGNYESYKPVINTLNSSGIKTYHITGNHDYSVDSRYLSRLPVFTESREGYYSIIFKNYRLIFMNGNEISTYAHSDKMMIRQATDYIANLKKQGAINAIEWNGGISGKQLEWFNGQLSDAADNSEKVIILCHFPIVPDNIHNLLNYKEVNEIISKHKNIIAWFSGHNHEGNYIVSNNVYYITFKGMVETKNTNSFAVIEAYRNKIMIKGFGRENSLILTF